MWSWTAWRDGKSRSDLPEGENQHEKEESGKEQAQEPVPQQQHNQQTAPGTIAGAMDHGSGSGGRHINGTIDLEVIDSHDNEKSEKNQDAGSASNSKIDNNRGRKREQDYDLDIYTDLELEPDNELDLDLNQAVDLETGPETHEQGRDGYPSLSNNLHSRHQLRQQQRYHLPLRNRASRIRPHTLSESSSPRRTDSQAQHQLRNHSHTLLRSLGEHIPLSLSGSASAPVSAPGSAASSTPSSRAWSPAKKSAIAIDEDAPLPTSVLLPSSLFGTENGYPSTAQSPTLPPAHEILSRPAESNIRAPLHQHPLQYHPVHPFARPGQSIHPLQQHLQPHHPFYHSFLQPHFGTASSPSPQHSPISEATTAPPSLPSDSPNKMGPSPNLSLPSLPQLSSKSAPPPESAPANPSAAYTARARDVSYQVGGTIAERQLEQRHLLKNEGKLGCTEHDPSHSPRKQKPRPWSGHLGSGVGVGTSAAPAAANSSTATERQNSIQVSRTEQELMRSYRGMRFGPGLSSGSGLGAGIGMDSMTPTASTTGGNTATNSVNNLLPSGTENATPDLNAVLGMLQMLRQTASAEELKLLRDALSPTHASAAIAVSQARQSACDPLTTGPNARLIRRKSIVVMPGTATRVPSSRVPIEHMPVPSSPAAVLPSTTSSPAGATSLADTAAATNKPVAGLHSQGPERNPRTSVEPVTKSSTGLRERVEGVVAAAASRLSLATSSARSSHSSAMSVLATSTSSTTPSRSNNNVSTVPNIVTVAPDTPSKPPQPVNPPLSRMLHQTDHDNRDDPTGIETALPVPPFASHERTCSPGSIEIDYPLLSGFAKGSLFVTNGAPSPDVSVHLDGDEDRSGGGDGGCDNSGGATTNELEPADSDEVVDEGECTKASGPAPPTQSTLAPTPSKTKNPSKLTIEIPTAPIDSIRFREQEHHQVSSRQQQVPQQQEQQLPQQESHPRPQPSFPLATISDHSPLDPPMPPFLSIDDYRGLVSPSLYECSIRSSSVAPSLGPVSPPLNSLHVFSDNPNAAREAANTPLNRYTHRHSRSFGGVYGSGAGRGAASTHLLAPQPMHPRGPHRRQTLGSLVRNLKPADEEDAESHIGDASFLSGVVVSATPTVDDGPGRKEQDWSQPLVAVDVHEVIGKKGWSNGGKGGEDVRDAADGIEELLPLDGDDGTVLGLNVQQGESAKARRRDVPIMGSVFEPFSHLPDNNFRSGKDSHLPSQSSSAFPPSAQNSLGLIGPHQPNASRSSPRDSSQCNASGTDRADDTNPGGQPYSFLAPPSPTRSRSSRPNSQEIFGMHRDILNMSHDMKLKSLSDLQASHPLGQSGVPTHLADEKDIGSKPDLSAAGAEQRELGCATTATTGTPTETPERSKTRSWRLFRRSIHGDELKSGGTITATTTPSVPGDDSTSPGKRDTPRTPRTPRSPSQRRVLQKPRPRSMGAPGNRGLCNTRSESTLPVPVPVPLPTPSRSAAASQDASPIIVRNRTKGGDGGGDDVCTPGREPRSRAVSGAYLTSGLDSTGLNSPATNSPSDRKSRRKSKGGEDDEKSKKRRPSLGRRILNLRRRSKSAGGVVTASDFDSDVEMTNSPALPHADAEPEMVNLSPPKSKIGAAAAPTTPSPTKKDKEKSSTSTPDGAKPKPRRSLGGLGFRKVAKTIPSGAESNMEHDALPLHPEPKDFTPLRVMNGSDEDILAKEDLKELKSRSLVAPSSAQSSRPNSALDNSVGEKASAKNADTSVSANRVPHYNNTINPPPKFAPHRYTFSQSSLSPIAGSTTTATDGASVCTAKTSLSLGRASSFTSIRSFWEDGRVSEDGEDAAWLKDAESKGHVHPRRRNVGKCNTALNPELNKNTRVTGNRALASNSPLSASSPNLLSGHDGNMNGAGLGLRLSKPPGPAPKHSPKPFKNIPGWPLTNRGPSGSSASSAGSGPAMPSTASPGMTAAERANRYENDTRKGSPGHEDRWSGMHRRVGGLNTQQSHHTHHGPSPLGQQSSNRNSIAVPPRTTTLPTSRPRLSERSETFPAARDPQNRYQNQQQGQQRDFEHSGNSHAQPSRSGRRVIEDYNLEAESEPDWDRGRPRSREEVQYTNSQGTYYHRHNQLDQPRALPPAPAAVNFSVPTTMAKAVGNSGAGTGVSSSLPRLVSASVPHSPSARWMRSEEEYPVYGSDRRRPELSTVHDDGAGQHQDFRKSTGSSGGENGNIGLSQANTGAGTTKSRYHAWPQQKPHSRRSELPMMSPETHGSRGGPRTEPSMGKMYAQTSASTPSLRFPNGKKPATGASASTVGLTGTRDARPKVQSSNTLHQPSRYSLLPRPSTETVSSVGGAEGMFEGRNSGNSFDTTAMSSDKNRDSLSSTRDSWTQRESWNRGHCDIPFNRPRSKTVTGAGLQYNGSATMAKPGQGGYHGGSGVEGRSAAGGQDLDIEAPHNCKKQLRNTPSVKARVDRWQREYGVDMSEVPGV